MRNGRLRGRFLWLLEEMCRRCGVDVQMIDHGLDYFENKKNIEEQCHVRLFLKPDKRAPEEHEKETDLLVTMYTSAGLKDEG